MKPQMDLEKKNALKVGIGEGGEGPLQDTKKGKARKRGWGKTL